ncbi:hypothetical protein GCM10023317_12840 [Actinopolymorpha pittospori]|uniref:Uncharacterized protein n=1 Tax=Actinopolymorpha pittospori TaxID=648752 RepID=A0A927N320_9ACTN|nr:hypothetical protein [Actinopolymorpha pittospori]
MRLKPETDKRARMGDSRALNHHPWIRLIHADSRPLNHPLTCANAEVIHDSRPFAIHGSWTPPLTCGFRGDSSDSPKGEVALLQIARHATFPSKEPRHPDGGAGRGQVTDEISRAISGPLAEDNERDGQAAAHCLSA